MKKFFTVLAMLLICLASRAERQFNSVRFGVEQNFGISNVTGVKGDHLTYGYGVGVALEYNIDKQFYIWTGLHLENIAHKEDGVIGTISAGYLQLPIHFGSRFLIGEKSNIFFQLGPTVSCGLFGSELGVTDGEYVAKINYMDNIAKRMDLGLSGRLGFGYKWFIFSLGANVGVLDATKMGGHNLSVNAGIAMMF